MDDGGWVGTTTYPVHSYAVTVTETPSSSTSSTGTAWTSSSALTTPTSSPTEGADAEETGPGNAALGQEAGMSFSAGAAVVAVVAAVL